MKVQFSSAGRFGAVVAALSVMLAPCITSAQNTTNPIPFADDFENNDGVTIIGSEGWYADDDTYAIGTNMTYDFYATTWSLNDSDHDVVVKLDTANSAVANKFQTPTSHTNVWIDTMLQPVRWNTDDEPQFTNTVQAGFFFDTNGLLNVYHSKWLGGTSFTNVLAGLSHTPVDSNEWIRLTITMDYLTFQSAGGRRYFQVQLNGGDPLSFSNAVDKPSVPIPTSTGTWFFCANQVGGNTYLSSVNFSGTGFFDDFVVTNEMVEFGPGAVLINASVWPARGGVMVPSNKVFVTFGEGTNFTVTPATHWSVLEWQTNGVTVAGSAGQLTYTDPSVSAGYTLKAIMDPALTCYDVPLWWLDYYGLDTNCAGASAKADGMTEAWKKYWMSADPSDPDSVLEITDQGITAGKDWITWTLDGVVDEMLGDFGIEKNTNLTAGAGWQPVGTKARASGESTWMEAAPSAGNPEFYQVVVTNTIPTP